MLKGRSLKSFAALVVFCFSLVVSCISPAWAATDPVDYDSAHGMTMFVGPTTVDPIRQGKSFSLPLFDLFGIQTYTDVDFTGFKFGVNWQSLEFQPFDYDVSLVLGFTLYASGAGTISATNNYTNYYCFVTDSYFRRDSSGNIIRTLVKGSLLNGGILDNSHSTFAPYCTASYVLPAGTNGVSASRYYWTDLVVNGTALLACNCAYIVHSGEPDVVDTVNQILAQVKKVNSNLAAVKSTLNSCLTTLNSILAVCQDLKADTSTIISVLNTVSTQLVSLNGKVGDIYTLLKDSLASESAAVDKKSEELAGQIMQRVDSEQYWSDKNTENFEALDMGNWSFGVGVVGALPTVGNLFKSLWDSIGDATLIFVFPLMLGIALVMVGRISRTAGRGHKKGGGDDG